VLTEFSEKWRIASMLSLAARATALEDENLCAAVSS
jgi:hypothetical protein